MNLKSLINDWRATESHERHLCADELEKVLKAQESENKTVSFDFGEPLPYMLQDQADDGFCNWLSVVDGEITDLYGGGGGGVVSEHQLFWVKEE